MGVYAALLPLRTCSISAALGHAALCLVAHMDVGIQRCERNPHEKYILTPAINKSQKAMQLQTKYC